MLNSKKLNILLCSFSHSLSLSISHMHTHTHTLTNLRAFALKGRNSGETVSTVILSFYPVFMQLK